VNSDIPSSVQPLVAAYLGRVDAEAPGLIVGLYLAGSIALYDYHPHQSDVDFVAVTEARADPVTLAALQRVHAGLDARVPRHVFEGIYLTWDDLARDPAACGPVPYVHERQFIPAGRFELSPVTWATLARHGVRVRGPRTDTLAIWDDPAVLDRWVRQNLEAYWRPWLARHSRLASRDGLASLSARATAWGALGVSRLHATLAGGEITSKYGAGLYAMRRFPPRWHHVLVEALRIRRGDRGPRIYRTPFGRRRDLLADVAMVLDDARGLPRS
jgi:hypothetical protein